MIESYIEKQAREHFERVTEDHTMRVLHDEGVYRHLLFRAEERIEYYYALVTWPGHLAINGDLDSGYVFARVEDMVHFFDAEDINPGYWSEKITNHDARAGTRMYSEQKLEDKVKAHARDLADTTDIREAEWLRAWEEARSTRFETETEAGAHHALQTFGFDGYGFGPNTWEWDLRDWKPSFLLSCHAIRTGVRTYLKASDAAE